MAPKLKQSTLSAFVKSPKSPLPSSPPQAHRIKQSLKTASFTPKQQTKSKQTYLKPSSPQLSQTPPIKKSKKVHIEPIDISDDEVEILETIVPTSRCTSPLNTSKWFSEPPKYFSPISSSSSSHSLDLLASSLSDFPLPFIEALLDLVRLIGLIDPFKPFSSRYPSFYQLSCLLFVTQHLTSVNSPLVSPDSIFSKVVMIMKVKNVDYSDLFLILETIDQSMIASTRDLCSFFFNVDSPPDQSNFHSKIPQDEDDYVPSESEAEYEDFNFFNKQPPCLIVLGRSGSGKSMLISFVCSLLSFKVLSFGSETSRDKSWLSSLSDGLLTKSLTTFQSNQIGKLDRGLIVLDDLDSDPTLDVNVIKELMERSQRPIVLIFESQDSPVFSHLFGVINVTVTVSLSLFDSINQIKVHNYRRILIWFLLVLSVEFVKINLKDAENICKLFLNEKIAMNCLQLAVQRARFLGVDTLIPSYFSNGLNSKPADNYFDCQSRHGLEISHDDDVDLIDCEPMFDRSVTKLLMSNIDARDFRTSRWELLSFCSSAVSLIKAQMDESKTRRRSKRGVHFQFSNEFADFLFSL
ncbi:hypothetical protein RCL1_008384 [Eukaryota sp. TZLM3-RCL]